MQARQADLARRRVDRLLHADPADAWLRTPRVCRGGARSVGMLARLQGGTGHAARAVGSRRWVSNRANSTPGSKRSAAQTP